MFTSALLIALYGVTATAHHVVTPSWHSDYGSARNLGRTEHKPLAVFIGSGQHGWDQVAREGRLGNEASRILAEKYVCVYVDVSDSTGRQLASAFELAADHGVVLSDASGNYQAYRHAGDLSEEVLTSTLLRHASPGRVAERTEGVVIQPVQYVREVQAVPVSYAAPSYTAPTYAAPTYVAPAYSVPAYAAPSFGGYYPSFRGSSGSC